MKLTKIIVPFILITFLVPISVEIYKHNDKDIKTNNSIKFIQNYGWSEVNYIENTNITVSTHEEHLSEFQSRYEQSKAIGLDYSRYNKKKADIYIFSINKKYNNKQIYAHVLYYKKKLIGAYLQSEYDKVNEFYIFSLKDTEFQNPIIIKY